MQGKQANMGGGIGMDVGTLRWKSESFLCARLSCVDIYSLNVEEEQGENLVFLL